MNNVLATDLNTPLDCDLNKDTACVYFACTLEALRQNSDTDGRHPRDTTDRSCTAERIVKASHENAVHVLRIQADAIRLQVGMICETWRGCAGAGTLARKTFGRPRRHGGVGGHLIRRLT